LMHLGVPVVAAHLFVFYFGIIADITPPVCSAAFAGAGIAGANPLKTGFNASKLAVGAFIIPYMFVLSPELVLIDATPLGLARIIPGAIIGMMAISSSVQGWMITKLTTFERIVLVLAGLMLIETGLLMDSIGFSILALFYVFKKIQWKKSGV